MNINTLLQWLWGKIDVIAIVVSLISLALSIIGFSYPLTNAHKQEKWYILKKLWSERYRIFHLITLFSLTVYVLSNWEKCISMQFFSHFDGNNILFLVWVVLIFLTIYEVEGKGIKVAKHKQEEVRKNLSEADLKYKLETMSEQFKKRNLDNTCQNKEGGSKNGLSD